MWYKPIVSILSIVLLAALQITLNQGFNLFLSGFNLVLILIVVLINLTSPKNVILSALLGGFILDVYSSLPFGIFMFSLLGAAFLVEILFMNFLTNRSFYALIIMGLLAVVIYNLFFIGLNSFFYFLGWSNSFVSLSFIKNFIWQLVDMALVLSLSFSLINYLSKKFKPVFLQP